MKTYNKLVRDKIPEINRANRLKQKFRILDDEAYLHELIKKLDEEIAEFKQSQSIDELADIQEVVLALADAIATCAELETTRQKKLDERGGFKNKIFLERVDL